MKNQFAIISGSTRINSQSLKVAKYLQSQLVNMDNNISSEIVDLAKANLPFWHEGFWDHDYTDQHWQPVAQLLQESDGIVLISPEWNGMAPAALMNIFLLAGNGEMAHKPALIVTVSGGSGGAYPVAELRSFGPKNTQICYIPDHVVVRNAASMLNEANADNEEEQYLRDRIDYSLKILCEYANALAMVRNSNIINLDDFPYGM